MGFCPSVSPARKAGERAIIYYIYEPTTHTRPVHGHRLPPPQLALSSVCRVKKRTISSLPQGPQNARFLRVLLNIFARLRRAAWNCLAAIARAGPPQPPRLLSSGRSAQPDCLWVDCLQVETSCTHTPLCACLYCIVYVAGRPDTAAWHADSVFEH